MKSPAHAGRVFLRTLVAACGLLFLGAGSLTAHAAGLQVLSGHVPPEVKQLNLQPLGRLPASQHLKLGIALSLRNEAELQKLLREIYNPASPHFRKYLSVQETTALCGATEADHQAVLDFIQAHGLTVTGTYSNRLYVSVEGTVENIENTLHVKMQVYQHPTEARTFFAPDVEPSLDLAVPVQGINGLTDFHLPRSGQIRPLAGAGLNNIIQGTGTNGTFQGADLRHAYAANISGTGTGQTIGLYAGSTAIGPRSVYIYETNCGLSTNITVRYISVGGFNTNYNSLVNTNDGEQCLDIEMCLSMAPGASVWEYETGDLGAALAQMLSDNVCKQISTSITFWPPPSGGEGQLEMMAAQGQSFFAASGDGGAYDSGTNVVFWPSASTNVTSVGGTDLITATPGGAWNAETGWPHSAGGICSGTDFSVGVPPWQMGMSMSANQGSTSYRDFPDVSMVGDHFWLVTSNGYVQIPIAGTSGASPLWAAFTALVNEQGTSEGLPTVGFLNPVLYSIGNGPIYTNAFHDITIGTNFNTGSPTLYTCTTGYDLVTGWGSPNGLTMVNALLSYAGAVWVDFNYTGTTNNGSYFFPYKTLAAGVSAVPTGGTIYIRSAGSSTEKPNLTKAMNILANLGDDTIGN